MRTVWRLEADGCERAAFSAGAVVRRGQGIQSRKDIFRWQCHPRLPVLLTHITEGVECRKQQIGKLRHWAINFLVEQNIQQRLRLVCQMGKPVPVQRISFPP